MRAGRKNLKRVVFFDSSFKLKDIKNLSDHAIELQFENIDNDLLKALIEKDKDAIRDGSILKDAINQGLNSIAPDLIFHQIATNYPVAEKIYGGSLLKLISGYNPDYINKNIQIPEFRNELKDRIKKNAEFLREKNLVDKDFFISEQGIEVASIIMLIEELDNLVPEGILGEKVQKKRYIYGSKERIDMFKKGDRYKDIDIKKSAKLAIRRNHKFLEESDLKVFQRESRGQSYIIYALDASGSMKGNKLEACKRAGIALAFKATSQKDNVGIIVFGAEIKKAIKPTTDFSILLKEIANIRASDQTEFTLTFRKATELFPSGDITKHLILITDALPTSGEKPFEKTLEESSIARNNGITISLIGVNLNEKGKALAEKIVEIGQGRLYIIKDVENIDKVVLEDYYSI